MQEELIAIVAHDLKSPLSIIASSSELLLDGVAGSLNEDQREFISRNHRLAMQCIGLIRDLLEIQTIEAGAISLKYENISIVDLITSSIDDHIMVFKQKRIRIIYKIPKIKPIIIGDASRLSQVINNLVVNASLYTNDDGVFEIQVESKDETESTIGQSCCRIALTNSGEGIPAEHIENIFDKYKQLSSQNKKKGHGLGLTIAKEIVLLHQGKIWACSDIGKSTSFIFELPSQPVIPKNVQETDKKTILIIDDTEDVIFLTRKILTNLGYEVIEAVNGKEGLEKIRQYQPDLVLLDIEMPIMNGIETLKEIRACSEWQNLPVIIHTAKSNPTNIAEVYEKANDFIHKPANINEFSTKISRLLSKTHSDCTQKKILIVDPEIDAYERIEQTFKSTSTIIYAKNGLEALFLYKKHDIELIFCELYMPNMDGIELIHYLKTIPKPMPPFYIVSKLNLDLYKRANNYFKVTGFLEKPFNKDVIDQILNKLTYTT